MLQHDHAVLDSGFRRRFLKLLEHHRDDFKARLIRSHDERVRSLVRNDARIDLHRRSIWIHFDRNTLRATLRVELQCLRENTNGFFGFRVRELEGSDRGLVRT